MLKFGYANATRVTAGFLLLEQQKRQTTYFKIELEYPPPSRQKKTRMNSGESISANASFCYPVTVTIAPLASGGDSR
jgi:hypothetical protein